MELNLPFLRQTFFLALHGIPVSLFITVAALVCALLPAYFMALARIYHIKVLAPCISVVVSCIRATPFVVQILIIYSLLPSLINNFIHFAGWNYNIFDLNPVFYAVVVFSIHTSVMLSEIIRGSVLTVDRGQLDAAYALGMSPMKAFRLVIMPQAAVQAIPNLGTLTVNLFKETSLSFLMTVKDITAIAKIEASYGYNYIEAYIDIFVIYLIVCSAIQLLFYGAEHILKKSVSDQTLN
jgi:L-cystine transport system permease protein